VANGPGPGVDAEGRPVIDPTQNVLDLVDAAIRRQDDLREAESRHVREVAALHVSYGEKLRLVETELRTAESRRIDAIRAVDVAAVQRTAEVAGVTAETLRANVAATATAAATALANALEPILKSIADLQRAQYETQGGRAQVVEQRDIRGETRLNWGAVLGAVSVALVLIFGVIGVVLAGRP
jgi:hypothetical protein